MCVFVCVCAAGGVHASTLLEAVQSGHRAATREGIEAELHSGKLEGEGPAGTTGDKVSMHWSVLALDLCLAPLWSD